MTSRLDLEANGPKGPAIQSIVKQTYAHYHCSPEHVDMEKTSEHLTLHKLQSSSTADKQKELEKQKERTRINLKRLIKA